MRRLIITADDLGINAQRSHGIFQCVEFGVVTNASLMPNGADRDMAGRHARERGVAAGLHLTLTEDYPLNTAGEIETLLESNGAFLPKAKMRKALEEGAVDAVHLAREIRAQVEWMFDIYGAPTHVDGHHHIHVWPAVVHALLPVLERYGIRFVRVPLEEPLPLFGYEVPAEQMTATRAMNERARAARELYAAHGILSTDHFRGLTLAGNASLKNLRHVLGRLPEGTTELMVHPGSQTTYGTPFDLDPQRQTELRMLLDESIPAFLQEKKIELRSWSDL